MIARRMEADRPVQHLHVIVDYVNGTRIWGKRKTAAQHKQGCPWWRSRFADLVERRRNGKKITRSLRESLSLSTRLIGGVP